MIGQGQEFVTVRSIPTWRSEKLVRWVLKYILIFVVSCTVNDWTRSRIYDSTLNTYMEIRKTSKVGIKISSHFCSLMHCK